MPSCCADDGGCLPILRGDEAAIIDLIDGIAARFGDGNAQIAGARCPRCSRRAAPLLRRNHRTGNWSHCHPATSHSKTCHRRSHSPHAPGCQQRSKVQGQTSLQSDKPVGRMTINPHKNKVGSIKAAAPIRLVLAAGAPLQLIDDGSFHGPCVSTVAMASWFFEVLTRMLEFVRRFTSSPQADQISESATSLLEIR